MSTTGKQIAKVGGGAAAVATVIGALATAYVQVRPTAARVELERVGYAAAMAQLEERRRHSIDEPVAHHIVGTKHGVVALNVYESTCTEVATTGNYAIIAAGEHRSTLQTGAAASHAGFVPQGWPERRGGQACNPAPEGRCSVPADHPTWDSHSIVGYAGPDGFLPVELYWAHGCRRSASWRPADGAWLFGHWICCAHG